MLPITSGRIIRKFSGGAGQWGNMASVEQDLITGVCGQEYTLQGPMADLWSSGHRAKTPEAESILAFGREKEVKILLLFLRRAKGVCDVSL